MSNLYSSNVRSKEHGKTRAKSPKPAADIHIDADNTPCPPPIFPRNKRHHSAMKRTAITLVCILYITAYIFADTTKKIDASSNEKLQETFIALMTSIESDDKQQKFASAMATIGVVLSQQYSESAAHKKYVELVDGKTADEIIETAKKMTPQIRGTIVKIDGTSAESFNKSVGRMLLGISLDKQRKFSSALARIMYDAEQTKKDETQVAKMLHGKTVDEVIEFARPIKSPFPSDENQEFYLSPLTKEELKAGGIIPKDEEKKREERESFSKSLVPRG